MRKSILAFAAAGAAALTFGALHAQQGGPPPALPTHDASKVTGGTYALDPNHTQILYTYKHLGLTQNMGLLSGATGTLTWSLKSGTLPAGLALSSAGVISGTPTTPTSGAGASFVVQVQDSGPPQQTVSQSFTIRIGAKLAITTATLPAAKLGVAYSTQLAATGGIGTITWSLAAGSGPLPGGLTLSSAGVISGTSTAIGTFNFTVQAADSSTPQQTTTKQFSITVNAALTLVFTVQPSNTSPNSQITPAIKVQVLDANGNGVSGVTITLSIAVNPGNGVLSGTTVAVSANKGIALFANNSIDKVGIGYRLQATAPGAAPALSNPFNIQ